MKTLFTILLLFGAINLNAQYSLKQDRTNSWKKLAVYGTSITLGAVGDGLNLKGQKTAGHICEAGEIGTLLLAMWLQDELGIRFDKWYKELAVYTTFRFATFNYIHNAAAGLPIEYLGNTELTDKLMNNATPGINLLMRSVALGFTLSINF